MGALSLVFSNSEALNYNGDKEWQFLNTVLQFSVHGQRIILRLYGVYASKQLQWGLYRDRVAIHFVLPGCPVFGPLCFVCHWNRCWDAKCPACVHIHTVRAIHITNIILDRHTKAIFARWVGVNVSPLCQSNWPNISTYHFCTWYGVVVAILYQFRDRYTLWWSTKSHHFERKLWKIFWGWSIVTLIPTR